MSVSCQVTTAATSPPPPFDDPLALLDTGQVARLFGVAEISLRIWRLKGSGPPYIKLGRSVKYRRSDLESYLASRTAASTSEALP